MLVVPDSARLACWLNAWLCGRQPADDVIAAITTGGPAEFIWVDEAVLTPALLLLELRRWGADRVSVALPVPGNLVGLAGPAEFNADALESGQAVVLHGAGVGFVPVTTSTSTRWLGAVAHAPSYLPDLAEADRELRVCLRDVADSLAALEVAAWRPDIGDALMNSRLPTPSTSSLPFGSARAAAVAHSALRALSISDLASNDEGGALTAAAAAGRRSLLRLLDRAARAALATACSSIATHETRPDE